MGSGIYWQLQRYPEHCALSHWFWMCTNTWGSAPWLPAPHLPRQSLSFCFHPDLKERWSGSMSCRRKGLAGGRGTPYLWSSAHSRPACHSPAGHTGRPEVASAGTSWARPWGLSAGPSFQAGGIWRAFQGLQIKKEKTFFIAEQF